MSKLIPISATIISFNEEANIERCLNSLKFCDDVVVIDSFSTDKTKAIVQNSSARFYENAFAGYGQQKNFAANMAKHEWILNVDADEEITPELRDEIIALYQSNKLKPHDAYQTPRLTQYCGKWIYYGGWYPNFVTRFYNKNYINWTEPKVHESLKSLKGEPLQIKKFKNHMHHYSFPTFKSQVEVNTKYAALGARDLISRKKRKPYLFEIFLKPIGKFIECYLVKRGFMDGKEGFFIALNASFSIYTKYSIAYFDLRI